MKRLLWVWVVLVMVPCLAFAKTPAMSTAQNAFDFSFTSIDGKPLPLSAYKGKVLLVVNTASRCGFTPQYEGLQSVYEKYKDKGLMVVGVPSNNFGGQEPGTSSEIKEFTSSKFHISFPLTTTTQVVGDEPHPFYQWAKAQNVGGFMNTVPSWNFHKYLIGRNGQLIESFSSMTKPDSKDVTDAIETALAQP